MPPTRSRATTTRIGKLAIAAGVIGAIAISLHLATLVGRATNPAPATPQPSTLLLGERVLSLATKLVLIWGGVQLVRGARSAWMIFAALIVLSSTDSIATYLCLLPPPPEGLTMAGRAGREFGRAVGLVVPPILYALIARHARRPVTQAALTAASADRAHRRRVEVE